MGFCVESKQENWKNDGGNESVNEKIRYIILRKDMGG